ncbi:MAG: nucleotide exchange factor GrpE [Bacteroidales bacterium]|nr:nucleotide exchange factor GrpE [Bacteroidales bacterium]MDY5823702.1 nucleotide exchange factor GrpE [Candidatus Coprenecus sp.]
MSTKDKQNTEQIKDDKSQSSEKEIVDKEDNGSTNESEDTSEANGESDAQSVIEELTNKLAQANDKYIRLAAEFDNYRRRTAKERLDLISTAGEDVIKGFLPILDDCERALEVLKKSEASEAAIEGTELIFNKIMTFLKGRGVSVIDALGQELDTDYHEAVAKFPVDDKEKKNRIIDVVQQGYKLNEKVIRFSKVVVGV